MQFDNVTIGAGISIVPPLVVYPAGQQEYITPGTYSWTAPAGITSVCVVCVGGGGRGSVKAQYTGSTLLAGGGGGGLGWKNNISVTPGQSYTVVVGAGSPTVSYPSNTPPTAPTIPAQDSYFISTSTVKGGAGGNSTLTSGGAGGTYVGDGGGNGGAGGNRSGQNSSSGGGGAGGYSGNGGNGGAGPANGTAGSGGGGGGGGGYDIYFNPGGAEAAGGGGVGIYGEGSSGARGNTSGVQSSVTAGGGGSGGTNGVGLGGNGNGGSYGGGGAGMGGDGTYSQGQASAKGGDGAVRIIWAGTNTIVPRSFPSTNTGNL